MLSPQTAISERKQRQRWRSFARLAEKTGKPYSVVCGYGGNARMSSHCHCSGGTPLPTGFTCAYQPDEQSTAAVGGRSRLGPIPSLELIEWPQSRFYEPSKGLYVLPMGRSGIDSGQFTSGQNSTISVCVPNREPYYRTVPFPRKAWSIPFKHRSVGKHSN
jgi:hypothetical protein